MLFSLRCEGFAGVHIVLPLDGGADLFCFVKGFAGEVDGAVGRAGFVAMTLGVFFAGRCQEQQGYDGGKRGVFFHFVMAVLLIPIVAEAKVV